MNSTQNEEKDRDMSFAETAMRLGGKSEEEAKRTGAVDKADDQVEALFAPQYKTSNSPIHKAVWEDKVPLGEFAYSPVSRTAPFLPAMKNCVETVRRYVESGTIYNERGKVCDELLADLGKAGYWGMLIDSKYGGQGSSIQHFMNFLTQIATVDPTVAGLASVHGCIGAVDPVSSFGTEEQKKRFLPRLASGETLSAFALTEPGAGSDLTALKTTAKLEGDHYVVNGEKLFITNAVTGRTIGLVCLIDGKPAALIAELPKEENENFRIVNYGLYALKHAFNNGLVFTNFKVPKENLLKPQIGDGLTVAYHGLNLGRLALCSGAAGTMRLMLANMLPWAKFRKTYGQAIETRELVKRRIARTAALICGADALVNWGSYLLDQGYRGELECIIAKIFGSEAQKEVAIEYFMKTHGGRSFMHGHMFGDNVHDFLAPCIYEGEGEMLGMAFFKSLAKQHGSQFFEPVGKALEREKIKSFNPLNPAHAFALRNELMPYASWRLGKEMAFADSIPQDFPLHERLQGHVSFALRELRDSPIELSHAMVTHQLRLADRQCRIADMSQRIQDAITIIVTALHATTMNDEVTIDAADILCQDLTRKLTGERVSDSYFKACRKLADKIIEGKMKSLEGIRQSQIMFPYS
ncbi:MAG: acyl-CoA/acyl-ACP dehydrogenase [Candidatus Obscuribacterales bacterium]|jgi:alkylation response protein AidB-like acyl-CoA dehydrogenase|nr:acyl-CoA/acyl-ACP dehydrogenase [Candidatus Obscuribacterales bacterium]